MAKGRDAEFIWWNFMEGVTASTKSEQYQQALGVTKREIQNNPKLDKAKLGILLDRATAVYNHRKADHGRWEQ